jgi:hypothetical protein
VERENLRRESLESPSIAVLGLEVGECQKNAYRATATSARTFSTAETIAIITSSGFILPSSFFPLPSAILLSKFHCPKALSTQNLAG